MAEIVEPNNTGRIVNRRKTAQRDVVGGGIIIAALIMFVGLGSRVVTQVVGFLSGIGGGVDRLLQIALTLNIALILFGWRRYVDLSREVDERAVAEERAQTLAMRDPLTGLYNRRALGEQVSDLLVRAVRRDRSLALLMFDLDHFKNINDVHGHATGDALIEGVAESVLKIVPANAITARIGGDEFACAFLFDNSNAEMVDRVAAELTTRLAQPFDAAGKHVHVSASVGISRSEGAEDSVESIMRRADIAMYAAKHQGRNRAAWFDISMERELQARSEIETGLRNGIPKGEFVPYFEKQIDLTTGRIRGFEILARWENPNGSVVGPDAFIGIAEETGMIADLSMAVMRQAFLEARSWDPSLTISVNISPVQLKDPWLAQKLVKLLTETGFPANRLEIEITESSLFDNLALAQSIIGSLKNQGIKLALDDFGTGYSSLAHLRALPFDRIKIDKSFVISIIENAESAAIVNAITRLGDSLGLPVTAEGIEDAAIEERLRQLGCHKGQGWYYGRPLSLKKVRALLGERNLVPAEQAEGQPASFPAVLPTDAPVADDWRKTA